MIPAPPQVKIQGQNKEMLAAACQMFLGKSESEIGQIALETLEGHQRAIMAHMTVEVGLGEATPSSGKPRPSQDRHTHLGSNQCPPFGMGRGPFKKSQISEATPPLCQPGLTHPLRGKLSSPLGLGCGSLRDFPPFDP